MGKKFGLIALTALATLVSCHNDREERIVMSNNEVSLSSQILSRAIDSQWESGDEVGVYMFSSSKKTVLDKSSNCKYLVSTDGNLTPATEMDKLYYPLNEAVDFIAYYPFNNVENYTMDIDVSDQTHPEEIDFLYSNNLTDVVATNETQSLQFNHLMSKLNFTIQAGTGVDASDLKGLTLKICNIVSEASISLIDGKVTCSDNKTDIITRIVSSTSSSLIQTEAIVIPQGCDEIEVMVSLPSGQNYLYDLKYGYEWKSGNEYTYQIDLIDETVNALLVAQINDWTTGVSGGIEKVDVQPWDGTTICKKWYSPDLKILSIYQPCELAGLAELVNSGINFEGKTIYLSNDLDMNNKDWTAIGISDNNSFKGTFLGNNHLIKNLNPLFVDGDGAVIGLFGVSYGTICRLNVSGNYNFNYDKGTSFFVGGICAVNEGEVTQCRSYAEIVASMTNTTADTIIVYVGGVVGQNNNVLSNCQNYGTVSVENINTTSNSYIHVGGIAGSNMGSLTNCENTRNVTGRNGNVRIGGVVAISSGKNAYLSDCSNIGDISITASHYEAIAGGVVGKNAAGATVSAAYNKGAVEATLESGLKICGGGIIGMNDAAYLMSGENRGDVTLYGVKNDKGSCVAAAGGGVGYNTKVAKVHQAINSGTVQANSADVCYCGGITGYNETAENMVAYTYASCSNNGYPLQWVGNATDQDDLVTED